MQGFENVLQSHSVKVVISWKVRIRTDFLAANILISLSAKLASTCKYRPIWQSGTILNPDKLWESQIMVL